MVCAWFMARLVPKKKHKKEKATWHVDIGLGLCFNQGAIFGTLFNIIGRPHVII